MRDAASDARGPVRRELLRAAAGALATPYHFALHLTRHGPRCAELRRALDHPAEVEEALPASAAFRDGAPLELFVSCAEPSGELHAVNLVRALRAELEDAGAPPPRFVGLGSPRLAQEGVRRLGDPVSRAAMGADVLRALPFYLDLLRGVADHARRRPLDGAVLVDSPALHVPVARLLGAAGCPVAHFATPQYWGWAPWRVADYRRAIDLALTILPFEPAWFRARGVRVAHVGHPLLDELAAPTPTTAEPDLLALLPGSRESVVRRNLPWMLARLAELRRRRPGLRVLLPCARPALVPLAGELVRAAGAGDWVRVTEDLPGTLGRARSAFSVSGTILIDLLARDVPAVVVYRLERRLAARLAPLVLTVPWFASINLLAGEEIAPEFTFAGEGPRDAVLAALERSLTDEDWRATARRGMDRARARLGPPGATRRAARHVLGLLRSPRARRTPS